MSVLICYDGSPSAKAAVLSAATTLTQRALPRQEVALLHVWNRPTPATDSFSYGEGPGTPSSEQLIAMAERGAQEIVQEGRDLAMGQGLVASTLLAPNTGSVAATILQIAEEQDSSLIVLGAHPHGTPGPTLDSISTAVIAGSSRPVLVIPMSQTDDAPVADIAQDDGASAGAPQTATDRAAS